MMAARASGESEQHIDGLTRLGLPTALELLKKRADLLGPPSGAKRRDRNRRGGGLPTSDQSPRISW
jgi:hypothetical protein